MADSIFKFIKYSHIENTSAIVACERHLTRHPKLRGETWVATEKVDGANFQFCTDGMDIICCSRNRVLTPGCQFHNYQKILEKYKASVEKVHRMLSADRTGEGKIVVRIYGELFGGFFPRGLPGVRQDASKDTSAVEPAGSVPSIDKMSLEREPMHVEINARPVQKRVVYNPAIDFYLFDIKLRLACDSEEESRCLNMVELMEVASKCSFPFVARPLHQGTYDEMRSLDPSFLTTIPEQLGYPPIAGNVAEGFVLRPLYTPSSYRLKLKHERFSESVVKSGEKSTAIKQKVAKSNISLNDEEKILHAELMEGITLNRLVSVVSKCEGNELRGMDNMRLTALLVNDALDELLTDRHDLEEVLTNIDKPSIRRIKGAVYADSVVFVKENRPSL